MNKHEIRHTIYTPYLSVSLHFKINKLQKMALSNERKKAALFRINLKIQQNETELDIDTMDKPSQMSQQEKIKRNHKSIRTLGIILTGVISMGVVSVIALASMGKFSGTTTPCPEDWMQFNQYCYYFSDDRKTFTDASAFCQQNGGNLSSIHGTAERAFIFSNTEYPLYWIGLYQSDTWMWTDGTCMTLNNTDRFNGSGSYVAVGSSIGEIWKMFSLSEVKRFSCKKAAATENISSIHHQTGCGMTEKMETTSQAKAPTDAELETISQAKEKPVETACQTPDNTTTATETTNLTLISLPFWMIWPQNYDCWTTWTDCENVAERRQHKARFRICGTNNTNCKQWTLPNQTLSYEMEIKRCENFPVDGTWLAWGNWQDDATCGIVLSRRTRQCQQPQNGGKTCQESKSQIRSVDTGISCKALTGDGNDKESFKESDMRPSAISVGSFVIIVMSSCLGLIVVADLPTLWRHLKMAYHTVRHCYG